VPKPGLRLIEKFSFNNFLTFDLRLFRSPKNNAFSVQASTQAGRRSFAILSSQNVHFSTTPLFCNHCDNPPCTKVCPTQATWKREDGIVMMDWHRCIGCRYCMAACPYGSRSFNWRDPRTNINEISNDFPTRTKGVVEKCTFCDERIAKDLMPACVEACTEKALIFGDLNNRKSDVRKLLKENFSIRRKPGLGTEPEIYYIV